MNPLRISIGQGGNQLNYSISKEIINQNEQSILDSVRCPFDNKTFKNILIDSEKKVIAKYMNDKDLSNYYNTSNIIQNNSGRGNNWAMGYSIEFSELNSRNLVEESFEKILKLLERSDFTDSFHFFHAVNGGTGSGLTSRLIEMLNDKFPKFRIVDFPIFGFDIENTALSVYNQFFTYGHIYKHIDFAIPIKNEFLSAKSIQNENFNFQMINSLFAEFYYDMILTSNYKYQEDVIFNNFFSNQGIKFIDMISLRQNSYDINEKLESNIKNCMRKNLKNSNFDFFLSSVCQIKSNEFQIKSLAKSVQNTFSKSINSSKFKFYEDVNNKSKDIKINILNNGLDNYWHFKNIYETSLEKIQSKAYLFWYRKFGISDDDIIENSINFQDILNNYEGALKYFK